MPFYLISLFLIHEKVKIAAQNKLNLKPALKAVDDSIFNSKQPIPQLSLS